MSKDKSIWKDALISDSEHVTKGIGKNVIPVKEKESLWSKYLENDLAGDELLAGKSTRIEWFKPVFAEDVLTSTCTVSKLTKRNEKNGIVELTFEVFNQNLELVLTDVTEMIVKCKPSR